MMYKHGIEVEEKATSYTRPSGTQYGVQVVVGTAPVHLTDRESSGEYPVNVPVLVSSWEEAVKKLGYSDDWTNYTLCQSMYASFKMYHVSPVIFINVMDPTKHVRKMSAANIAVIDHQAALEELMDRVVWESVVVKADESSQAAEYKKDYMLSRDDTGVLVITLLAGGKLYDRGTISVSCNIIDIDIHKRPVEMEDIIGGVDAETGQGTGLEAIRMVYSLHGIVPSMILVPGWSQEPNVGAAMTGKCENLNGLYRCECVLDLGADKYTDCQREKEEAGFTDPHDIVLWPPVLKCEKGMIYYSAVYGAMASYYTATNGDVPYLYPSNKLLGVTGMPDVGTVPLVMDQAQAAELNGAGIVTVINDGGWKSWGNNTGAYPDATDPKDRWIGCRRMFSFVANYFILQYRNRLDGPMNRNTIDDIVNAFNIWGNSLVSQGRCAGLRMEYNRDENSEEDLLNGHLKVRIYFAPYTPMEYILATEEFDTDTLVAAINGEEE